MKKNSSPHFPEKELSVNSVLKILNKDGKIYYSLCGNRMFSHDINDADNFRYITSKCILLGLCKVKEVVKCFSVDHESVKYYRKKLKLKGDQGFFVNKMTARKLTPKVIERVQKRLEKGDSISEICRRVEISRESIRIAIKDGRLSRSPSHERNRYGSNILGRKSLSENCPVQKIYL